MIIESVRNPIFVSQDNNKIDVDVKFDVFPDYIPFTASPDDPEEHGREVYLQCIDGMWGEIAPYSPPPPPSREEIISQKWMAIQTERNRRTQGGIYAADHWFPSNTTAQEQWSFLRGLAREIKFDGGDMNAVMLDANGNPWRWQTLDDGEIDMTANLVIEITNRGAANQNQNFQNAKRHRTLLEQSQDPASYDFSDGWTEIWEGYL